jgi:hypothetical protein
MKARSKETAMDIVKDPATGAIRIGTSRSEVHDLRDRVEAFKAFSGSDEWDLNDAWRDGFNAALDVLTGRRLAEDLVNSDEDDDIEDY